MIPNKKPELYEYIWGILKNKNCHLYRINGTDDHIHIAAHLHPSIALAPLVKDIKLASSAFIKDKGLFEKFSGWQERYAAFTYSFGDKNKLIEYVKTQEEHHRKISFKEELIALLEEHSIEFEEKYLF